MAKVKFDMDLMDSVVKKHFPKFHTSRFCKVYVAGEVERIIDYILYIPKLPLRVMRSQYEAYSDFSLNLRGMFLDLSRLNDPRMCRNVFQQLEMQNHYIHSHISSFNSKGLFRSFCKGTFSGLLVTSSLIIGQKPDPDIYYAYLVQLLSFLGCQSYTGSPYKDALYLSRGTRTYSVFNERHIANLMPEVEDYLTKAKDAITFHHSGPLLRISIDLSKLEESTFERWVSEEIIVKIDSAGATYRIEESEIATLTEPKEFPYANSFDFKGKIIDKYYVIPNDDPSTTNMTITIRKEFLNALSDYLSYKILYDYEFYKRYPENTGAKTDWYNRAENGGLRCGEDKVSLC